MAKAADVELDGGMPFVEAARETVRVRSGELFEHLEHVLDMTDIERVHAARVATRRLRAVLEIYAPCFAAKELKPVLSDVKALADDLGARRDPDVQLDALQRFAAAVPEADWPGIDAFGAQIRDEQQAGNARLAAALERIRDTDLHPRLLALTAAPREATVEGLTITTMVDPSSVDPEAAEDEEAQAQAPPEGWAAWEANP